MLSLGQTITKKFPELGIAFLLKSQLIQKESHLFLFFKI